MINMKKYILTVVLCGWFVAVAFAQLKPIIIAGPKIGNTFCVTSNDAIYGKSYQQKLNVGAFFDFPL